MRFKDYSGTEQFRPLSAWAYFGYGILFMIPIVGWLFLIVFTFSTKNYNRRSFARSYWCGFIITGIISIILVTTGVGFGWLYDKVPALRQWLPESITTMASPIKSAENPTEGTEPIKETEPSKSAKTPGFRAAMDEYEAFFDSYIEFMNGFQENKSSPSQLTKYFDMLTRYSETMEALEKIDESTLSKSDKQYYLEVTMRINHKLASVVVKQ